MFMQPRQSFHTTRSNSPTWSESDPSDIIAPCESEKHICETTSTRAPVSQDSFDSNNSDMAKVTVEPAVLSAPPRNVRHSSPESDDDIRELWNVMLGLQQRYHCYNSTRMQIAADSDAAEDMMPSRACIELLNESIEDLPKEGWKILEQHLGENASRAEKRQKWRFWKSG